MTNTHYFKLDYNQIKREVKWNKVNKTSKTQISSWIYSCIQTPKILQYVGNIKYASNSAKVMVWLKVLICLCVSPVTNMLAIGVLW